MTKINRLTQIPTLDDSDLAVVWQDSSERTRAITIANLRKFIQSTDPNADAFVKAELIGDELVLTSHDENETRIDINLLPEHSVTELKDMPDELIAGNYLKVSDDGTDFVLTPASEISAAVLVREGGQLKGLANVLDFGNAAVSLENRIARINSGLLIDDQFVTKIYTENDLDVLIEDEVATISINNQVSPWPIEEVGIGDSPKVIDKVEQLGIEYQFEASSTFTQSVHLYHVGLPEGAQIKVTVVNAEPNSKPIDVFQLSSGSDLRWPVITPTVFTLRSGLWRVEESSQLLHVANATTFDDDAARKKIVHGVAVDPNGSITMDVNDDGVLVIGGGGVSDEPTFKAVKIDTNGSGQPNFTASIHQDNELHTVIDATRELRVNYKDIGTGTTTGVMGIDNNQAQFLVPILQGADPVALKKEIPVIPDNGYIEKYTKAETDYVQIAYQGKYGDDRVYYPSNLKQDVNGWLQFEYTGNLQFKPRDKDTDALSGATLRLGTARSDFYHPLYVDGKRVAERTPHNIYNSYSLNNLINSDGKTLPEWIAENPDYTQVQFLNTLFSCTILGAANWVVSFTTSGEDYNGTFPNGYQQIEIHRNGGGSRSFLRAYNKESPVHYFANYKANQELDWKQYAYTDELGVLKDKTSYDNEIQNIDTTGTGVFAEYLGYGSTSAAHTHTFDESGVFWISNLQSSTRPKTVNVISSNGAEMTGISVPFNRVVKFTYSSDIEEIITEASYADVDINSNTRNSYSGQGLGTPKPISVGDGDKHLTEPVGYYISQPDKTGNLTIYVDDTGGYNEFRVIYDNADNQPRDIKVSTDGIKDSTKTIQTGEVWECRVSLSRGSLDQNTFFWTRLDNGESGYILEEQFNSKSGYSKLVSGGGSTHTITYSENGSILKISNATVKVQLLQGMSSENPHGYIKYINSHNDDVAFEWYDRNGNQVTSNVPSVCPSDTVVEIFADYAKDEYVLNFGQSKVIQSINEDDELREGLAQGFIYAKEVSVG